MHLKCQLHTFVWQSCDVAESRFMVMFDSMFLMSRLFSLTYVNTIEEGEVNTINVLRCTDF